MMQRTVDAIESLALALWVGGLASFAFVFAPLAFHAIADRAAFGALTARVLTELGVAGAVCGALAIAIELSPLRRPGPRSATVFRVALLAAMLLGTAIETLAVVPRMAAAIPRAGAATATFDEAHHRSSLLYGIVLLCGIATIGHRAFTSGTGDARERRGA